LETSPFSFRLATTTDLPKIILLLSDDPLGATRESFEDPLPKSYYSAFEEIDKDPNNELLVIQDSLAELIGVLQLTFIPSLTYRGGWRAMIEAVRIDKIHRSLGLGRKLVSEAIKRARKRNCVLVQLTSDKTRPDSIRFYEELGFVASHEGLKLKLEETPNP